MIETRDTERIGRLLALNPVWGAYALGDLDPAFFSRTRWFLSDEDDAALVLVYASAGTPTVMTFGDAAAAAAVFREIPSLDTFHIHYPETHRHALDPLIAARRERYLRLGLRREDLLDVATVGGVEWARLTPADAADALALYVHYPENFFDPERIDEGRYIGGRADGQLVVVGGTHVWSARTRVAAVGDIVTDPAWRGRGLGTHLTWRLCRDLLEDVDLVVLNVAEANLTGRRAYEKVGFRSPVRHYEAFNARRSEPGG